MSHHEAQKIRKKLAPFMSLLLVVACMGLLASCGGGGGSANNNQIIEAGVATSKFESNGITFQTNTIIAFGKAGVADSSIIEFVKSLGGEAKKTNGSQEWEITINFTSQSEYESIKEKLNNSGFFDGAPALNLSLDSKNAVYDPILQSANARWSYESIGLGGALDLMQNKTITPINIGVIDSGFSYNHPDISYSELKYVDQFTSDYSDRACVKNNLGDYVSAEACDNVTHGTHVSGIIGEIENEIGSAGILRNPSYRNLFLRGAPQFLSKQVNANIQELVNDKSSSIINMSFGSGAGIAKRKIITEKDIQEIKNQDVISIKRIREILSKNNSLWQKGVLFVQAAGNNGEDKFFLEGTLINVDKGYISADVGSFIGRVVSESLYKIEDSDRDIQGWLAQNTIFVGAFHLNNGNKRMSAFSQTPQQTDISTGYILAPGGAKPEYGADYAGIVSTVATNNGYSATSPLNTPMAGTSMAAPHVTGVAGLIAQINPILSASDIKKIILTNSDTVDGYRALNAEKAVRAALDTLTKPTVSITATSSAVKVGEQVTFTANVTNTPNGAIKSYAWKFGDGGTSSAATQQYIYSTANTYTVELTITDAKGVTATATLPVIVSPATPIPTVTGITAPSTLTATKNATFSINGSNLPTGENLVITPSGVGCTDFGYGTRSATDHTFACTPSAAGTLTFTIATAGGVSLGSRDVTVSQATTAKIFNDDFNTLDTSIWTYTPGTGNFGAWTGYSIENSQFKFGQGALTTESKKLFTGGKLKVNVAINRPSPEVARELKIYLVKSDWSKYYGIIESYLAGTKSTFIVDSGNFTQVSTYASTPSQMFFQFIIDNSGITLSENGGSESYGAFKGFTDGRNITGDYFLRIIGDGVNYIEGITVTTE